MSRLARAATLVALVGSVAGCGQKSPEGASSSASVERASVSAAPAPSAEALAAAARSSEPISSASTIASAPPPVASASWPAPNTPPPTEEEWAQAPDANTADAQSRAPGCALRRVREWYRVTCDDKPPSFPQGTGLGKLGTDFFTGECGPQKAFTVRSRPGEMIEASLFRNGSSDTHVRIAWPTDRPSPSISRLDTTPVASVFEIDTKDVGPVPAIPELETSPRPVPADWLDGVEVNTAAAERRLPHCSLRLVRDWIRVRCGRQAHVTLLQPPVTGKKGSEVLYKDGAVDASDLWAPTAYVRARKGTDVKMLVWGDPAGVFELEWGINATPVTLSLTIAQRDDTRPDGMW